MKLEGSLDAFSLPDIFQLLSFTKKIGGLHLRQRRLRRRRVLRRRPGHRCVRRRLAPAARPPPGRRRRGRRRGARRRGRRPRPTARPSAWSRRCSTRASIEGELLRQAATDQSVDAVFDLLRWQQGDFAFVVDEANPDDVGVTLSVEASWPRPSRAPAAGRASRRSCPSADAVLSMPVVLPADPQLTRDEWSLLALVDGRRSVAELVDLTGSGQYAVVSTLAGLVARGLLEVRDAADASRGPRRCRRTSPGAARRAGGFAIRAGQELGRRGRAAGGRSRGARGGRCRQRAPDAADGVAQRGRRAPGRRTGRRRAPRPATQDVAGDDVPTADGDRARDRADGEARSCSSGPTCPATSCRRGRSRSCPSARPTSTSRSVARRPAPCRCGADRARWRHRRQRRRARPRGGSVHRAGPQRQPEPAAAAHRRRAGAVNGDTHARDAVAAARPSRSSSPDRSRPARRR